VFLPRGLGVLVGFRPRKEVAALEDKPAALSALEPAPHRVLPIGRVQDLLPDVVTVGAGPPGSLLRRDTFERLREVGAVPGLFGEGLVIECKNGPAGIHNVLLEPSA